MNNHSIENLEETVSKLRDPIDGCPWDLEQTHESLIPYLHEEAKEVEEVIISKSLINYDELCEELGDVLLQVLLHSQLAKEKGKFGLDDVIRNLNEKLIRRHPHVFGSSQVKTLEEVEKQWEEIKNQEQKDKDGKN